MKRFLCLMAVLWPLRKPSAVGNWLLASYGNYKRKLSSYNLLQLIRQCPLELRSSSAGSSVRLDTRSVPEPCLTRTRSAVSPLLLRSFSACSPLLLRCFSAAPPLLERRRNGKQAYNKRETINADTRQVRSGYCAGNDRERGVNVTEADKATGRVRDGSQTAAVSLAMWELSAGGHSAVFAQRTPNEIAGMPHEDPTMMQSLPGTSMPVGKARPTPCSSPPSLTLPSTPIRMCPVYTSVKSPKSSILPKKRRQTIVEKGDKDGQYGRVGLGISLRSAWELGLDSVLLRIALLLLPPNQGSFETNTRPNRGSKELRRRGQESSSEVRNQYKEKSCVQTPAKVLALPGLGLAMGMRRFAERLTAVRDWLGHGKRIVRPLIGQASASSRSVAEGLSKPSRTTVEALSKDCRTSLEQQSNTCRRTVEGLLPVWWPNLRWMGIALGVCAVFLSAVSIRVNAQQIPMDSIKALQIGDIIPEEVWNLPLQVVNHPEGKDTITLNEYRGKLIILDFWATWCVPCIVSMPKMDSLQKTFDEEVLILPVTYETASKAGSVFTKHKWQLPTVVDDTLLKSLFSHKTIPHHVWINKGEVAAATYPVYATVANIHSLLNGTTPRLMAKEADPSKLADSKPIPLYQSLITRRNPQVNSGFGIDETGVKARNLSIKALYRSAFSRHIPYSGWNNRIILEVDSAALPYLVRPAEGISGDYRQDSTLLYWNDNNTYCYTSVVPMSTNRDTLLGVMQRDLNSFFGQSLGIHGRLETRYLQCLVIRQIGTPKSFASHPDDPAKLSVDTAQLSIHRYPMEMLASRLATLNRKLPTPIVDGTGYKGPVSLELRGDLRDPSNLNDELGRYGLALQPENQAIDILVIYSL